MIGQPGRWAQTPSTTSLQPKEWNAHFWITFKFWWLAGQVDGLKPHLPSLSSQKNEMLVFGLCSTSYDWPGRLMDSNPICYPSPAKIMKCSFLDFIQLMMISQAGRWTGTPSATPLQERNEKLILLLHLTSDDQPGWSMDSNPIHPPLFSQKNEMLIFGLCSTSDDQLGWSMDSNPVYHLSPAKKWKAHFWITFNFWYQLGWSMNMNPICHLSPAKKMKCSFLDYVPLLMISMAGQWIWTLSTTPLQPK